MTDHSLADHALYEPGDVVMLRSGGQPITVVGITEQGIQCVWLGEEGDLFSATLPAAALQHVDDDDFTYESDHESEDSHEEETHLGPHEVDSPEVAPLAAEKAKHAA